MSANAKQVGGAHYRTDFQHWDWMIDTDLGYLEGCATKYLVRWRQKNGIEDLKKSVHYLEKIREAYTQGRRNNFMVDHTARSRQALTKLFIEKNETIGPDEGEIIMQIAMWQEAPDLDRAIEKIQGIISHAEKYA